MVLVYTIQTSRISLRETEVFMFITLVLLKIDQVTMMIMSTLYNLDKYDKLDLKRQSLCRHVAQLGHISRIPSQTSFALR